MSQINTIQLLLERGWSHRKIARELGIHRETVGRYVRLFAGSDPKPAISTAGSGDSKPAISTAGIAGRKSFCQAFREVILEKIEVGLSAQRIYQDLCADHGFEGGYESVKRFVRKELRRLPLPFRRMESSPGEEIQVDFGSGAPVLRPGGKKRRPHLFRVILSYSRKAYSEVVWKQNTETFIRCLENAFRHFGGVPRTLILDNLKAAVTKADWYDPDINPKFAAFAEHYGIAVLPTKPYTPRHKGKIEAGVKYSQGNALKGREFKRLEEQNEFLFEWERKVADQRIHGTTRRQVRQLFEQEREYLRTLPTERFPCFHEAERKVHRDGHVAIDNSFYSVPPEYLGLEVWARWDSHFVRIFDKNFNQIAVHAKVEPGRFSTHRYHIATAKISGVEKGAAYLLKRAALVGADCARWSQALIRKRGIQGMRTLQGLLSLVSSHPSAEIERACRVAHSHESYRLKTLRHLLRNPQQKEEQESFLDSHPLIRDMAEYGDFIHESFKNTPVREGGSNE
jgi:transposase